jgi:ABC-2 type transport system ATP-binding protein
LNPAGTVARELAGAQPEFSAAPVARETHELPLALSAIGKGWKGQPPVLDGVDLRLDLGARAWIGGRNGVGKTTLMRIAAGLIDPDSGRATVWGRTAAEDRGRYHRLVALLSAGDRGLYARLTVRRQLEFWGRVALVPRAEWSDRITATIDEFALGPLAGRRVDRLSMGQRQRLRLAMTFMPGAEVVLLDEPLTSLDDEGAEILSRALDALIARHGALLWCSPSGEHLDQRFDARWLLDEGRLVQG